MIVKIVGYFPLSLGQVITNAYSSTGFAPITYQAVTSAVEALYASRDKYNSVPVTTVMGLQTTDEMKYTLMYILKKINRLTGDFNMVAHNDVLAINLDEALKIWAAKVIDNAPLQTASIDAARELYKSSLLPVLTHLVSLVNSVHTQMVERRQCIVEYYSRLLYQHNIQPMIAISYLFASYVTTTIVQPISAATFNSERGTAYNAELESLESPIVKQVTPLAIFNQACYTYDGITIMKILHLPYTPALNKCFNVYGIVGGFSEYLQLEAPMMKTVKDDLFINDLTDFGATSSTIRAFIRRGQLFRGELDIRPKSFGLEQMARTITRLLHPWKADFSTGNVHTRTFDDLHSSIPYKTHIVSPNESDILFNSTFGGTQLPANHLSIDEFSGTGKYLKILGSKINEKRIESKKISGMYKYDSSVITGVTTLTKWVALGSIDVPLHKLGGYEFPFTLVTGMNAIAGIRRSPKYHMFSILDRYKPIFIALANSARVEVPQLRVVYKTAEEKYRTELQIGSVLYDELVALTYGVRPFNKIIMSIYD